MAGWDDFMEYVKGFDWTGFDLGKKSRQKMGWLSTILPWEQAATQKEQWQAQFDWRKAMDEWTQGFQKEQFEWDKEQAVAQRELAKEQSAMAAFGRRWQPQSRWM